MRQLSPIRYIAVLDLETGAKTPDAHIFSIGVTLVDVEELILADAFYYDCHDKQPGRVKDADTLNWWIRQSVESPQAFKAIFNDEDKLPLDKVLNKLMDWFALHGDPKTIHLMGNGPEFDNVIIEHALNQAGLKMPVPYFNNQSLRTIKLVHRLLNGDMANSALEALPFEGVKHHAGDDADYEAEQLLVALKCIRGYQLYDQEITELKQQLQQQKMAYEQKLKELEKESIIDFNQAIEQASAWQKVFNCLNEVYPEWLHATQAGKMTAADGAVYAIKVLNSRPTNIDMHFAGIGRAAVQALDIIGSGWHNVSGDSDAEKVHNSILELSKLGRPISLPDGPVKSVYDINKLTSGPALDADVDALNQDS